MKRVYSSIFLLFSIFFTNQASHIVGGEFRIVWKGKGYTYQVTLSMYVDNKNADPGVIDGETSATAYIFRKSDNTFISDLFLPRVITQQVSYQNSACANSNILQTLQLKFQNDIYLDPAVYNDPAGYYIVWERCCRNEVIKNIANPGDAGMAFYMEFPPVIKNGVKFTNTSPLFNDIVGDYICKDQLYNFAFGATDPNGDSLSYRIATPLEGHASPSNFLPGPISAPYDSVIWNPGYSVYNQIPGAPSVRINKFTGLLTVKPNDTGLFVYGIVCDEFRNGVKIGQIRRDFQILVITCPDNYEPEVKLDDSSPDVNGDTISVKINDKNRCIPLFLTDSNATVYGQTQGVYLVSSSTNLPPGSVILPAPQILTPQNDTIKVDLCFDLCNKVFLETDSIYDLTIIIRDDACNAKTDTLKLKVIVDVPDNNVKPTLGVIPPGLIKMAYTGVPLNFTVAGIDPDTNDILTLTGQGIDFALTDEGMIFNNVTDSSLTISSPFQWIPDCEDVEKSPFEVKFFISDNSCIHTHKDSIIVRIEIADFNTELPNFLPTNLVTPNGDGLNDVYEFISLPLDNCTYFFKRIEIYNVWGARVYRSDSRDFIWDPINLSDGMYYYSVDLNKKTMRGWVQVIR